MPVNEGRRFELKFMKIQPKEVLQMEAPVDEANNCTQHFHFDSLQQNANNHSNKPQKNIRLFRSLLIQNAIEAAAVNLPRKC